MFQKKYLIYFVSFLSVFVSCTLILHARRGHVARSHRGRVVRCEPRSSVRVGFGIGVGSTYGGYYDPWYDDPWYRYRGRRSGWFGWWPRHEERVIVVHESDDDYEVGSRYDDVINETEVNRYKESEVPVVKIVLPSMGESFFTKDGNEYQQLAALYAAKKMGSNSLFRESYGSTSMNKEKLEEIMRAVDVVSLFDAHGYRRFMSQALKSIKKDRKKRGESLALDALTKEDLDAVKHLYGSDVHVDYHGLLQSIDSLDDALKKIVQDISNGEFVAYALPVRADSRAWASVKVEKKDGVVYVLVISYK